MKNIPCKFYAVLIISAMLFEISLSAAFSSLIDSVTIESIGQISLQFNVNATSGSASDIQAAIDQVVAAGGIGNVFIPEGTFNFVEVGEPWMPVEIPAGINLFGAPTNRDANDEVVEWKTVLVMSYDVPGPSYNPATWFKIIGNSDPNKPSRFCDIKLVGYRYANAGSTTVHCALQINEVVNFHIDHCYFRDTTGGIKATGSANSLCCGVVDHCKLINTRVTINPYIYDCDAHYGVSLVRYGSTDWEDDISVVLGQYLNYSLFVEDCYFSKWRHCVSANDGTHYVFRHNTIEDDAAYGSLDAHGTYNFIGTRAVEIYNNLFLPPDPDSIIGSVKDAIWIRGGGGVIFNNTVEGYTRFVGMTREGAVEKCWPHDIWIWNNTLPTGCTLVAPYDDPEKGAPQENEDYFLYKKPDYTPYLYPHPLTLEAQP